jgi:hypothetical protein
LLDHLVDLCLSSRGKNVVDFCVHHIEPGIVEMPGAQHQQRGPPVGSSVTQQLGGILCDSRQRRGRNDAAITKRRDPGVEARH